MKIFTLSLAFMAWIECTISVGPITPLQYTSQVRLLLIHGIYPWDPRDPNYPYFNVEDGDKITIRKVIGAHFVKDDIVYGHLLGHDRSVHDHPAIEGQHGEVKVKLLSHYYLYHAFMRKIDDYKDNGVNTGQVKYLCTIERNEQIFLGAILRLAGHPLVPFEAPRVGFLNHYHPQLGTSFTGELVSTNPVAMEHLLNDLLA